jgi:hypothetical protein
MSNLTKKDLEDAMYSALRRSGAGGGGFSGTGSGTASGGTAEAKTWGDSLKKAADLGLQGGKALYEATKSSVDSFQKVSNAGSNFSNDIIGMSVSAAESRLSLTEFSDVVKNNGKDLAGLGGSVTRGTEAFSRLSKGFFESRMTDELKQLGFTSKELNEVLAIQAGSQRYTTKMDEEGRNRTFVAAQSLAKEMDAIAKLTGKNREEQMREMQDRKTNAQIQAKLTLIGIEQGAEAEAKARAQYQEIFAQAEAQGMGDMARELFATGTVYSENAQNQFALTGDAAEKLRSSMQALERGQNDQAAAFMKQSQEAAARLQRDPTFLRVTALGDAAGTLGNVAGSTYKANMALGDAAQQVANKFGILLNSQEAYAQALNKIRQDIAASARGESADGRQVSGATRGAVAVGVEYERLRAEAARAAAEAAGNAARQTGQAIDTRRAQTGSLTGFNIEENAIKGLRGDTAPEGASAAAQRSARGGIIGDLASVIQGTANFTANGITNFITGDKPIPSRETGSVGMTGKIIEDFGAGTLAMLHGKEGIITEEQLQNLAAGIKETGIASTIETLKSATDKLSAAESTLDIESIISDMTSTVGSAVDKKQNLPAVDLNSIKLPGFGMDLKSATETATKTLAATTSPKSVPPKQTTSTVSTEEKSETVNKTSTASVKDASLNDVVKSLDTLNKQMGQLISQTEDIGMKQITATRSNNQNIYERF